MNVCQFVPQEMRVCAACWRAELLPRSLVVIIRDKERSGYCLQSFLLSVWALFARVLDIIFWNCPRVPAGAIFKSGPQLDGRVPE